MNTIQAKQIQLVEFFARLGFTPLKIKGDDAWFLSPFREEQTPSFKINNSKNCWYDFGLGKGGTIIDFVAELNHTQDISAVLNFIEQYANWIEHSETTNNQSFSFHKQKEDSKIVIREVYTQLSSSLKNYLQNRCINASTATLFCKEVCFENNGKTYFAIGFKNDKGGYELRNKYFKGCSSKSITTICNNSEMPICVFEGFFDFLSFCELAKASEKADELILNSNFMVLNSVALVDKAIEKLEPYSAIKLFLDNDNAGALSTQVIQKVYPQAKDFSPLYKDYKDLNEFLCATNGDNSLFERKEFISRCAIVRTESVVPVRNGNLAFTPEGRKRKESISKEIDIKQKEKAPIINKRRGICR